MNLSLILFLLFLEFVYLYKAVKPVSRLILFSLLFIFCLAMVFLLLYFIGIDLVLPTAYAEGSSVSGDSVPCPHSLDSEAGPCSNNTSNR